MTITKSLLSQVREQGHVRLPDDFFERNGSAFTYTGDDINGTSYWTSGGRSIIIGTTDVIYKISGIDPEGKLTEKVAMSQKNRLKDVCHAHQAYTDQKRALDVTGQTADGTQAVLFMGKPFGVYTLENINNARIAFSRLNRTYCRSAIEPPCDVKTHRQINDNTYHLIFGLPKIESDLRVSELLDIIEEKLATASQGELKEKMLKVNRLFGRIVAWLGYSMEICLQSGLVPYGTSWVPQNLVLHDIGNGYGIFRVDHTSTIADDSEKYRTFKEWIEKGFENPNFPPYWFSHIPEACQIGALYPDVANSLPGNGTPFARVINYYRNQEGAATSIVNVIPLIESHKKVFALGRSVAYEMQEIREMAIPEDYLRSILS